MIAFCRPSVFVVPADRWDCLLDCLCEQFPNIDRTTWLDRFERGMVQDANHQSLSANSPVVRGQRVLYFREIRNEVEIPFYERILFQTEHFLVADKPHFLPVTPGGGYVSQTLQSRLMTQLGNYQLQPVHRIDRHTAGLVLFSLQPETRSLYQGLFRDRQISKSYEAIAPALPDLEFPHDRASRIVRGEQFFLSQEVAGEVNSVSRIDVLERGEHYWRYRLEPVSGKKHQLRLHMSALGAPILHDPLYPRVDDKLAADYTRPLQLLARELAFVDPVSGESFEFRSELQLLPLV
ncbi:pseudouridine synthase [Parathalassolituus penaei]|uniref:Pseudouridine synthase n=1 Tax=Parathalassolituus penaei TaxID=2997323 RepID=A0A9X3EH90_9GAMM|nr:pseudouridine synthase [Parathalassolituus penaei]MCY0966709.1 pseudouridine synthase [Parathalassolituus penaei]